MLPTTSHRLKLKSALTNRNVTIPGGEVEIGPTEVIVYPSGAFNSVEEIGNVVITETQDGTPVYLRDLGDIVRGYQDPPSLLNFYKWQDESGDWHRSRAITLAVQMRQHQQIGEFGNEMDTALAEMTPLLPADLIIAKVSDQKTQTDDNLRLFIKALIEAVILVVFVGWLGFREWRSAVLLAVSIPLTLAMTFGFANILGIEIQQVSIASLIIALGLLVDDPVVADDAIKSNLALGHPSIISAWLGPIKLARAILFATATNINELTLEEKRTKGFTGFYYRIAKMAIENRKKAFAISLIFFVIGGLVASTLKSSFFPLDVQYLSYVDVWMPNEATLSSTNDTVIKTEQVIREVAEKYAKENKVDNPLESIATYVGGGSPRFWSTVAPKQQQKNYGQLIITLKERSDTPTMAPLFQEAISEQIPGAHIEVRQIQLNAVDFPIQIHLTGRSNINSDLESEAQNIATLRELADVLGKDIWRFN